MGIDARGDDTESSATASPVRPQLSAVSTLGAGLQAAQQSRTDFLVGRSGRKSGTASDDSSRSPSPEVDRDQRPIPTKTMKSIAAATGLQMLSSEGLLLDAHKLVRDASVVLDVFKGFLLVLMVTSNVIITMSSTHLRSHSFASLVICNAAASHCFVGFLLAFGFSCYGQYLLQWPDPHELSNLRSRVSRAVAFPLIGAWVCNFVWCFLCLKNDFTTVNVFDVFTFSRVFGSGPDFLCSFSLDLALVYALWPRIVRLLDSARSLEQGPLAASTPLDAITRSLFSRFSPESRRDMMAVALALSPLLLTLAAVPDCTGNMRWVQWLLVCDKRDVDTPSLAALPHLADFGVGILVGACWNRFLADLRPVGNGGPGGGVSILPMPALRRWSYTLLGTSLALVVLFVPLGQVWFYTDLSVVQMPTSFGQLTRGFSDGPSMLWLLATLWPSATSAGIVVVLVTLRGTAMGSPLRWPLACLEHLGANVLYYVVVTDMFLAGMFRGISKTDPFPFTLPACLLCTILILLFARFLNFLCKESRK